MIYKGILILGWLYLIFGVLGIYRFPDLYSRLLTSSKIDTVAVVTIILGLILKIGFQKPSIKLLLTLVFILLTTPVTNHVIARSAYMSGVPVRRKDVL